MQCPFGLTSHLCETKPQCIQNYQCYASTTYVPLQNSNRVKRHDCVSKMKNELEKQLQMKKPKRNDMSTQYNEEDDSGVECLCKGSPTATRSYCSLYSRKNKNRTIQDFSANCNLVEIKSCFDGNQSNKYMKHTGAQTKKKGCINFTTTEYQDCFSQSQTARNTNHQKPGNSSKLLNNTNTPKYSNKMDQKQCLDKSCTTTNENDRFTSTGSQVPLCISCLNNMENNPNFSNKDLLDDIQYKISDINKQCDWAMKQNKDFVKYLWRLCNAKTLQCDWANLAKQDPFSESYTQTEPSSNPTSNQAMKSIESLNHENNDVDQTTPEVESNRNNCNCYSKPKIKYSKCNKTSIIFCNTPKQCNKQTNTEEANTSDCDEAVNCTPSCFADFNPNNLCTPLIIYGTPFDFKSKNMQKRNTPPNIEPPILNSLEVPPESTTTEDKPICIPCSVKNESKIDTNEDENEAIDEEISSLPKNPPKKKKTLKKPKKDKSTTTSSKAKKRKKKTKDADTKKSTTSKKSKALQPSSVKSNKKEGGVNKTIGKNDNKQGKNNTVSKGLVEKSTSAKKAAAKHIEPSKKLVNAPKKKEKIQSNNDLGPGMTTIMECPEEVPNSELKDAKTSIIEELEPIYVPEDNFDVDMQNLEPLTKDDASIEEDKIQSNDDFRPIITTDMEYSQNVLNSEDVNHDKSIIKLLAPIIVSKDNLGEDFQQDAISENITSLDTDITSVSVDNFDEDIAIDLP